MSVARSRRDSASPGRPADASNRMRWSRQGSASRRVTIRRAWAASSAKTIAAPESVRVKDVSSSVETGETVAVAPLAQSTATSARIHSRCVAETMATRSPAERPRDRSPQVSSRTREAVSHHDRLFQAPSSGWRNADASGVAATRAKKRSGIERYGGGFTADFSLRLVVRRGRKRPRFRRMSTTSPAPVLHGAARFSFWEWWVDRKTRWVRDDVHQMDEGVFRALAAGTGLPPIHQRSTFPFHNVKDGADRFLGMSKGGERPYARIYTRLGNPTSEYLERVLFRLEAP